MGIRGFSVSGIGIKLDGHEIQAKLDHEIQAKLDHGTDLSILNLI
jgi:hypothetical protein